MRVTDRNTLPLFLGIPNGQLDLLANGRDIANIIEKWNVAVERTDVSRLRSLIRNRGGSGATVDEKEIALAKLGHQFGHHARVGGEERALMVVDACRVRDGLEHLGQRTGDFRGRHALAEFPRLGSFVADGLHRQMKHDLIATATSLLGDVGGMGVVGEDRECERVRQRGKNGVGRGYISAKIIDDNREARTARD